MSAAAAAAASAAPSPLAHLAKAASLAPPPRPPAPKRALDAHIELRVRAAVAAARGPRCATSEAAKALLCSAPPGERALAELLIDLEEAVREERWDVAAKVRDALDKLNARV